MPKSLLIFTLLCVASAAPLARADSVANYTITFTTSTGTPPASGSFTYDSTAPQFSNFFVSWDGITFNLTASANHPFTNASGCSGESSTAAYSFELLSQTVPGCPSSPVYDWAAEYITTSPAHTYFSFNLFTSPGADQIYQNLAPPPPGSVVVGQGFAWTITPAVTSTPEPSSLFLLATTLLGLAPFLRKLFGR